MTVADTLNINSMQTGSKIKIRVSGGKKCKHDWQYFKDVWRTKLGKEDALEALEKKKNEYYADVSSSVQSFFKPMPSEMRILEVCHNIVTCKESGKEFVCMDCGEKREIY